MSSNETQIIFRIDTDLKNAFERICRGQDRTISQKLRDYIRFEVQENARKAQGDLFKEQSVRDVKKDKKTAPAAKTTTPEGKKALLDMFKKR